MMKPVRSTTINGVLIEEFCRNKRVVVYVNGEKFKGDFDTAFRNSLKKKEKE